MNDAPPTSTPRLNDSTLPFTSPSSSASPTASSRPSRANSTNSRLPRAHRDKTLKSLHLHRKRTQLLDLLNNYDLLVYMNLAALYYLDTSTLLLLLRSLSRLSKSQLYPDNATLRHLNLTPRPTTPSVFFMLLINVSAFLIHALFAPPSAGEQTHGYLHGHLVIDLIGQKAASGWTGRARLCLLDMFVILLEFVALGISKEVQTVERTLGSDKAGSRGPEPVGSTADSATRSTAAQASSFINVFGMRRRADDVDNNGIELQPLASGAGADGSSTQPGNEDSSDAERDGDHRTEDDTETATEGNFNHNTDSPSLESLASGQAVVMHLRIQDVLQDQILEYRNRRLAGRV